jgi:hypothetical protein
MFAADETLAEKSLARLSQVLGSLADPDAFRDVVRPLRRRSKTRLRSLLDEFANIERVDVTVAFRTGDIAMTTVTKADAERSSAILREAIEDSLDLPPFEALLVGMNLRTKSYEVQDVTKAAPDGKFSGGMEPTGFSAAEELSRQDELRLGTKFVVVIRRVTSQDPNTGEERYKHRLLGITPA